VTDLVGNPNLPAGPVLCEYQQTPGPNPNALSVRYTTRTTVALNITQPALPTILIGKQVLAGPLAPALTGDIANYAAIANLTFNPAGTLADGSCVLYVGNATQLTVTSLLRNTTYTFALYTYNPVTGLYCSDNAAALLTELTSNRESLIEQPGAVAGVNIALSQISPNPVVNNVNLTMDLFTDANITVQVIDGNGQVISVPVNGNYYAEGTHTLSFPLQNVASGSYFLRVSTENEAVIQRFIYMP
ncbi:MAG TPA: T9SS type A sorting domain-containing protein, partial [Candidatus Kapabacteria bacterium]|nr:T9SS type A sorting domain-containing protein [Candidatus Kapabacteria bacterium]